MPDTATIRDMARKLELWRATLDARERETLTDWMAAGVGHEQLAAGQRWWFEPESDGRVPRASDE